MHLFSEKKNAEKCSGESGRGQLARTGLPGGVAFWTLECKLLGVFTPLWVSQLSFGKEGQQDRDLGLIPTFQLQRPFLKKLRASLWDMKVQKGLGCVLTQYFHQILSDCKHQKPWWSINTAGNVLAHANEKSRNFRHAAPRCLIDTTKTLSPSPG